MSALPEIVDAWRMVAARRSFEGTLPLRDMPRLRESLARADGEAKFALQFGRDEWGNAFLALDVQAQLPLQCQRTLEVFELPVVLQQRLGLIMREEDEAALPPGFEPLLTADGELRLADVIEDELILALPVVPHKPGTEGESEVLWTSSPDDDEANPFAALARLKKQN